MLTRGGLASGILFVDGSKGAEHSRPFIDRRLAIMRRSTTAASGGPSVHLSWKVRPNSYFDSIDLMRVAEQARQLAGVTEVAVVMGTATGRSMLAQAAMWPAEAPAGESSDLLVAVRASSEAVAHRALACVEELLSAGRDTGAAGWA